MNLALNLSDAIKSWGEGGCLLFSFLSLLFFLFLSFPFFLSFFLSSFLSFFLNLKVQSHSAQATPKFDI